MGQRSHEEAAGPSLAACQYAASVMNIYQQRVAGVGTSTNDVRRDQFVAARRTGRVWL